MSQSSSEGKKEGIEIILVTVQDILDKKFSILPPRESQISVKKKSKTKSGSTITEPHLFRKEK